MTTTAKALTPKFNGAVRALLRFLLSLDVEDQDTLEWANNLLVQNSTNTRGFLKALSEWEGYEKTTWEKLTADFAEVLTTWGKNYKVEDLLEAEKLGLSTLMRADQIKIGRRFSIPGKKGTMGVQKQWCRMKMQGKAKTGGQVVAQVVYGDNKNGGVELIQPDTIVQPHLYTAQDEMVNYGSSEFADPAVVNKQVNDHEAWCAATNAMQKRVDARIQELTPKQKSYVIYSAYGGGDVPVDNLDHTAYVGKMILFGEADEFYGGKKSQNYESPVLTNPTWLEIAVHANAMIHATRDRHHCFLEGIHKMKRKPVNGVQYFEFSMGS